jgi:hypothetical protein
MYSFAHEVLAQVRSQSQALADLLAKYQNTEFDHPERARLARMIGVLGTEIDIRERRAFGLRRAA